MILIADSGSTKTEWRFISEGKAGKSYISSGLNPYLLSGDDIYCLLQEERCRKFLICPSPRYIFMVPDAIMLRRKV